MKINLYIVSCLMFLVSCKEEVSEIKNTLFTDLPSSQTEVQFVNAIENSEDFNIFNYRNFYNGGGVAIGDINNDDLPDIYFTANLGANKLYLNKGDFKFEDISSTAGIELAEKWSTGVSMIDINADGFLDIYVCNAGYQKSSDQKNALFVNQGDNTFLEEAESYGLDFNDYSTQANFFDYDQDGDLDMYLLNNSFIPVNTLNYSNKRDLRAEDWPVADFLKGGGDKLLQNDNGVFKDVSEAAGIYGSLIGFGLGSTVGDINNDGLLDIYISNDFFERDYLYINKGDGTFSEELESRINHLSHSSMGADMADINNDGYAEIFVTDMLPDDDYRLKTTSTFDNINLRKLKEKNGFYNQFMHNTLQLNDGEGAFKEISFYADVAASDWSWGALMFDADNDSYNDLLVCNGILNDVIDQDFIDFFANDVIQNMVMSGDKVKIDSIIGSMPSEPLLNKFFRNNGSLKFIDDSGNSGITKKTFSNGAAYGDLDNDGDLDLVVNNVNQEAQIYRNNSDANYIAFKLKFQKDNLNALGSKIIVYLNENILTKELIPSRGFQSSMDYKLIVGLGDSVSYDSLYVQWPNGEKFQLEDLEINQTHAIDYSSTKKINKHLSLQSNNEPFFTKQDHTFPRHEEDDFIDFYYERNIPSQLSKEGPCVAKGDFNDDGLEDIYIGGGTDQKGTLLKQTKNGFVEHQPEYFEKFKAFEDTYALFFDADRDGDLDLFIGSGGNNVTYDKRAFRDRLYVNKNGEFEIDYNAIPSITLNTAVAVPIDLQDDGDLDLFVGMRSVPGEYGVSPGSFIYLNNGSGRFRDVTDKAAPELRLAGNITDAIVADVLDVPGEELILVGEWMSPKILSFDEEGGNVIDSELSAFSGWWQSVASSDVDDDGDLDLLFGNMGENFYLEASLDNPLFLWINDFDDNGSIEKIITSRQENGDIPVYLKRDMIDQIPMLKKENLKHADYAKKTIQELFPKEKIETSIVKQVNYLSSAIAYNEGDGHFRVKKMTSEAQLSCVNAFADIDLNKDGINDFILGGNNTYLLPQFSTLDACSGKILLSKKGEEFEVISGAESGLDFKGVVREIEKIKIGDEDYILVMINDSDPQLYKVNKQ